MTMLLEVAGLEVSYGAVAAVHGVDLHVPEGEIRVVLGANGAGKSSLLRAIIGLVRPSRGTVSFAGAELRRGMAPHKISGRGVGWVPEGREIFGTLTVEENLRIGAFSLSKSAELTKRLDEAYELFPILGQRKRQNAATLSGGEQQMLAIARALMSRPRLLLIDEPSLGLSPLMVQVVFDFLAKARDGGLTTLLVEQNAVQALRVANWVYVMQNGAFVGSGSPAEIADTNLLSEAFLGSSSTHGSASAGDSGSLSAVRLVRRVTRGTEHD
jgi:branched-chain amino acid transport system ATP-binding protein